MTDNNISFLGKNNKNNDKKNVSDKNINSDTIENISNKNTVLDAADKKNISGKTTTLSAAAKSKQTHTDQNYHQQVSLRDTKKLREQLKELPTFCKDFFRGIEQKTTTKTRMGYASDLRTFFRFLLSANPELSARQIDAKKNIAIDDNKNQAANDHKDSSDNAAVLDSYISSISLKDIESLKPVDIEEYMEYLKLYTYAGRQYSNDERGIHRKIASLKSFYLYYQKRELISNNPTTVIDMPKLHDKEIIRLDSEEVSELLNLVEHAGDNLTGRKKVFYQKNKLRNIAIFTLFLGTGIRVSECVVLNIEDVDFKECRIRIIRKGGKEEYVYFGDDVADALENYIDYARSEIVPREGHEHALFYSIQRRRMTVQAIEDLVKEYATKVTTFKHITPHKLRSTYGTALYRQTGDIYLVADVLGHNDVNTTKKHYAAIDDDKKRSAAGAVKWGH